MIHTIDIRSSERCEFIDITGEIEKVIKESRASKGACRIFVPHTTAGLTINENADPSVKKDITDTLNELVPRSGRYAHAEGNSDAHIKSSILGNEKTVFIQNGRLKLGTWQGIFFCEFDGPRRREVWVNVNEDTTYGAKRT
jgi:secondary thiamine-phosphate synthase enzyme